jgi:hypothetical protein
MGTKVEAIIIIIVLGLMVVSILMVITLKLIHKVIVSHEERIKKIENG